MAKKNRAVLFVARHLSSPFLVSFEKQQQQEEETEMMIEKKRKKKKMMTNLVWFSEELCYLAAVFLDFVSRYFSIVFP